ncbi:hypothetical protein ABC382_00295 [Lysinibacillus sp. 1P01SD]|uniref:hypothetical protein n=1 Tax=Lysinibacillus sp. 1P01SD TaxID=3132285 RepID=UPI0039A26A38
MNQCKDCGNQNNLENVGSGEDWNGEFTDYECKECNGITRVYDDEDKKIFEGSQNSEYE